MIRKCLEQLAENLPGYALHEVGAGYVDEERVIKFLSSFTPTRLIRLFYPELMTDPKAALAFQDLDQSLGILQNHVGIKGLWGYILGGHRIAMAKVF